MTENSHNHAVSPSAVWPKQDEILLSDPIAAAKVGHPFAPPGMSFNDAGLMLPDDENHDANEAAAAVALAELADQDGEEPDGETGEVEDDYVIEDPDDDGEIGEI